MHVVDFTRRHTIIDAKRIPDFALVPLADALNSARTYESAFAIAERVRDLISGAVAESERRVDERSLAVIHAVLGGDFERIAVAHRIVNPDRDRATYGNGRRVEITSLADAAAARANDPADRKAFGDPVTYVDARIEPDPDVEPDADRYAVTDPVNPGRYVIAGTREECTSVLAAIFGAYANGVAYGRADADAFARAKRDTLARAKPSGIRSAY